ncbi:MAG TPA: hypothetical protein VI999_02060 [Thermoplasmata archaeon]|nr:hypothetical protein [Thermoplasmata archaeon]
MPTMADRLYDIGKSPPQHLTFLFFGLVALLTGVIARAINSYLLAPSSLAVWFVAAILAGIGAFFVVLALFLGAYVGAGGKDDSSAWKIAQLIGAVVVLLFLL